MTQFTATFKGKDLSLGYRTGCEYRLEFTTFILSPKVRIRRVYGTELSDCVYGNIDKFFENWTNIKTHEA